MSTRERDRQAPETPIRPSPPERNGAHALSGVLNGRGFAIVVASCVAMAVVAGCFPDQSRRGGQVCPAPVASTDTSKAQEEAYWRNQYRQNRPVPPENYQVFPKPPRNNQFGEFDEGLYQGLDRQPTLPALPADSYAAASARGMGYPLPPSDLSGGSGAFIGAPAPAGPPMAGPGVRQTHAAAAPVTSVSMPKPAGIDTGVHFYPMEQLVFGGDYPDIDKPELYRLMPKDVITVAVRDHPEFSGQLEIQPDGTVKVPNAHDLVRLRGLTVDEAAEAVRQAIQVYVRGECLVRVQTNRARGGYYYVFGDVLQPGRFPMGLEPVRLSEAILAANWETNPSRRDMDGDELGPSFPAASPRGRYVAPPSADMARVMLITPHRSQPVRSVHDVRSALMGVTANDPAIRPGQIIVVPSLLAERNRALGMDFGEAAVPVPAEGAMTGRGFSTGASPARLPEVDPEPVVRVPAADSWGVSAIEANMTGAYDSNMNSSGSSFRPARVVHREEPAEDQPEMVSPAPAAGRRQTKRGHREDPPVQNQVRSGREGGGPGSWGG